MRKNKKKIIELVDKVEEQSLSNANSKIKQLQNELAESKSINAKLLEEAKLADTLKRKLQLTSDIENSTCTSHRSVEETDETDSNLNPNEKKTINDSDSDDSEPTVIPKPKMTSKKRTIQNTLFKKLKFVKG